MDFSRAIISLQNITFQRNILEGPYATDLTSVWKFLHGLLLSSQVGLISATIFISYISYLETFKLIEDMLHKYSIVSTPLSL